MKLLVFLLLLILVSPPDLGSVGQVITVPNKTGVLGDNPVTITCSYPSAPELLGVVMWFKKVQNQHPWPYLVAFPVAPSNSNSTFNSAFGDALKNRLAYARYASDTSTDITFTSIMCEDASEYRCSINTFQASAATATMTLTVEVTPVTAPNLWSASTPPYISGQAYTFTCGGDVGSPSGTITWYIHRTGSVEQIITQGVTDGVDSPAQTCSNTRTSTLEITLTSADNNANVYCKVSHKLLQNDIQSNMVHLNVQYHVTVTGVTISPDVNQYTIGSDVQLTCHAPGNPTPEIYWQYNPLNGNVTTNVTSGNGRTLGLYGLQPHDSGVYSCVAQNTLAGVTYHVTYPTNIDVVATTTPDAATTLSNTGTPTGTDRTDLGKGVSANSNAGAIAGGIVGVIAVLGTLTVLLIIYFDRRGLINCRQNKTVSSKSSAKTDDAIYENDVFTRDIVEKEDANAYEELSEHEGRLSDTGYIHANIESVNGNTDTRQQINSTYSDLDQKTENEHEYSKLKLSPGRTSGLGDPGYIDAQQRTLNDIHYSTKCDTPYINMN